ncbi:MAG: hypothetical protein ACRBHB_26050 [Arenicella sp.]
MVDKSDQNKLIALALYEIRVLLASKIGSENKADMSTRVAAHLAYALHNEASSIMEGKSFSVDEALRKIKAIDRILNEEYSDNFMKKWNENQEQ